MAGISHLLCYICACGSSLVNSASARQLPPALVSLQAYVAVVPTVPLANPLEFLLSATAVLRTFLPNLSIIHESSLLQ